MADGEKKKASATRVKASRAKAVTSTDVANAAAAKTAKKLVEAANISPSKKPVVAPAGAKRAEIEDVLLKLFRAMFHRPAFIERHADVRKTLNISSGDWRSFGYEINRNVAIRANGLSITPGQMSSAHSIADIATYLLASWDDKLLVHFSGHGARGANAAPSKPRPGRSLGSKAAIPEEMPADVPAHKAKRVKVPTAKAKSPKLSFKVARGTLVSLHHVSPTPSGKSLSDFSEALKTIVAGRDGSFPAIIIDPALSGATAPSVPPSFFFELEGEGAVQGDQALWGREFDLVFDYGILSEPGLAVLKGEQLEKLVKDDTHATFGIDISPVGLSLVSGGAGRVVKFEKGKMIGDPPRFSLRAPTKEEDAQREEADDPPHGVYFTLSIAGATIYSAFLKIELVDTFADQPRATETIDLDLAQVGAVKIDQPRQARLKFRIEGGCWRIEGEVGGVDVGSKCTTKVGPATLDAAYRDGTLNAFTDIAGEPIWLDLAEDLQPDPANTEAALASMQATASAGSGLYEIFAADDVFKNVLDLIDKLPDGSRISILSDGTAFPWELLYPKPYFQKYPPENYDPKLFWGRRFIIESLLIAKTGSETPSLRRRQPGKLRVSMGYNSGIDSEEPWATPGRPLLPVGLQKKYFDTELRDRGLYFDQHDTILSTFQKPYVSSLIYYFCHGSADELKFDNSNRTFIPRNVSTADSDAYPGWPVIFLNACDAANISPLSFFSFRTRFRAKKAAGVIAPSFPIPTLFAAVFAKMFLSAYAESKDSVGDILFRLRRQLLEDNNPLGLWYSLQCPLDLKAPLEPKA